MRQSTGGEQDLIAGILRRALQILIMFVVMALELFIGSGRLNWVWAWVFLGIGLLSVTINAIFMLRNNPEMIAERGKPKEVQRWDIWIGGFWLIGSYFLAPIIAGLDLRFSWTGVYAMGWHVAGALAYACGLGLSGWAMISNAYFSTAVRIQTDRRQQVCKDGPYRYVRHPGYVGFFVQALSTPLLLGSLWALLFAIPAGVLMVIRTSIEDHMLQEQLPGYKQYASEVKYRLLPFVW